MGRKRRNIENRRRIFIRGSVKRAGRMAEAAKTGRNAGMKGLELSRKYYFAYGKGMLEEKFPMLAGRVAAGLAGQGSECLGFDDGSPEIMTILFFCLWLTREDYEEYGNAMREEYRKLPQDFEGIKGRTESLHGSGRVGVLCIPDFYYGILGTEDIPKIMGSG